MLNLKVFTTMGDITKLPNHVYWLWVAIGFMALSFTTAGVNAYLDLRGRIDEQKVEVFRLQQSLQDRAEANQRAFYKMLEENRKLNQEQFDNNRRLNIEQLESIKEALSQKIERLNDSLSAFKEQTNVRITQLEVRLDNIEAMLTDVKKDIKYPR